MNTAAPNHGTGRRPVIRLKPKADRRIAAGSPWIYSNEVEMAAAKTLPPGSVVAIETADGRPVGTATFNPHTLIAARLLTSDPDAAIDAGFLAARFARADRLRQTLFDRPFYRLAHAEADGLPGLIVDRFDDIFVVQANSAGMAALLPDIRAGLHATFPVRAIIARHDSAARALEGLDRTVEVIEGTLDGPTNIEENGFTFRADLVGGQKTGWFFDHRVNRAMVAALAPGLRVLDVYAYGGGFGLLAAARGAADVRLIDRSQASLDLALSAAERASLADRVSIRKADAFTALEVIARTPKERADIVVADPPAFAKSRKDVPQAVRAYRKLARLAAGATEPEGFMAIASCSHAVTPADFAQAVARGLADAGRTGRILASTGAGPDHPVHPQLPESAYLKCQLIALD